MKVSQYPTRPLQFVLGVDTEGRVSKNVPGGPVGPAPTLVAGTTTTLPFGDPATVDVVPDGINTYRLDFGLPAGEDGIDGVNPTIIGGTVTTLAPGTPATASLSPTGNPGEYELDLGLPAGLDGTGTVNGPASSTVDYLVRWNSTNGTLLKEGVPIDAAGGVQSYSVKTAAIVALTWANDLLAYFTGASTIATTAFTSLARTILGRTTGAQIRGDIGAEPSGMALGITTYTASQTAVIGDAGCIVEMNVASANNYTIPPNSSVAFPLNTRIDLTQYGAGQTTVVAGAGVTIRSAGGKLKLTGQYSAASIYKRGTNEWFLVGDLAT